jgi:phasin family protein
MATTRKTTPKAAPKAAAAPAAKKSVQAVDAAVIAGQETVDTVVKTSTAVATKGVEKVVAMTEEQVAAAVKASKDAYKGYEEMVSFSKSNIDAVVEANEIFTTGIRQLNESLFKLAQIQMEEGIALAQKMASCESIGDVYALQSDAMKKQFVRNVEESRKIGDFSVKLAEKAGQPITKRLTIAVDTMTKPIAA